MIHTDKLTVLFDKIARSINQRKETTSIKHSNYYEEILKTLTKEGVIRSYKIEGGNLVIFLNIHTNVYIKCTRISKPGKRVYLTAKEIIKLDSQALNELYLLSTSQGIMSKHQSTLCQIGGEVLIKISYDYSK